MAHLINTIDELLPHVRVNANLKKLPDIGAAEQEFLLPIIGDDLYDTLLAYATDDDAEDSAPLDSLLLLCRRVIAPAAISRDLFLVQGQITDNGITIMESENTRKAFKWEFNGVQEVLLARAYAAQENLIVYLRKNGEVHTDWETSPYNDPEGFVIIRDGSELSGVLSLQQPHRCFMALKPLFSTIAETTLKDMMSEEQYYALNSKILDDSLSEEEEYLVKKLRLACGQLVMAKAVSVLNIKFGTGGFTVADKYAKEGVDEARAAADNFKETQFKEEMTNTGNALLKQAKEYMNAKASDSVFPEYFASGLYVDPEQSTPLIDNSGFNGTFGI